jgi:hypothetical protein
MPKKRDPIRLFLLLALLIAATTTAEARRRSHKSFDALQKRLAARGARVYDPASRKDIIVVPSFSLDQRELSKINGVKHYEERYLFNLLHLHNPRNRVFFVSSMPISRAVVDYYLEMLPDPNRARNQLRMVSVNDPSPRPLSEKILERPAVMRQLGRHVLRNRAHLYVFNVSELERRLSEALQVPVLGTSPDLQRWGTKAGSRAIFAAAKVPHPAGSGELRRPVQLLDAIDRLVNEKPDARRLMVKLNEGFSGEGNAIFKVPDLKGLDARGRRRALGRALVSMKFQAHGETWGPYARQLRKLGGIVEAFVEGKDNRSPSVQGYIGPRGDVEILSTHEQVLGGPDGQVFLGCSFPAMQDYRVALQEYGRKVGQQLARRGAMGRFAVDFMATREGNGRGWALNAVEINLRPGGTTHPTNALKLLVDGRYEDRTGLMRDRGGKPKYYVCTDNLVDRAFKGLSEEQMIGAVKRAGVNFDRKTRTGSVLHLVGAVPRHGKLGFTAIGDSPEQAQKIYERTVEALGQVARGRKERSDAARRTGATNETARK